MSTEMINEDGYGQFHADLAPLPNEAPHAYAKRLDEADLAVLVTSDDCRNLVRYRQLLAEAEHHNLPIVMVTGQLPEHYQDAQEPSPLATEEARSKYIEEARKTARPFPR